MNTVNEYDYEDDSTLDYANEWLRGPDEDLDVVIENKKPLDYKTERLKILKSYTNEVSGVYMITNLVDDKIYIGSSSDIYGRWELHKLDLAFKRHHSFLLQQDWDRLGGSYNFKFEIIWQAENEIDRNEIFFMEQTYINQHSPEYNIAKKVKYVKSNYNPKETAEKKADFIKSLKDKKFPSSDKFVKDVKKHNLRSYERYVRQVIRRDLDLKEEMLSEYLVRIYRYRISLKYNYRNNSFFFKDGKVLKLDYPKGQEVVRIIADYFGIEIRITPQGKVTVLKYQSILQP